MLTTSTEMTTMISHAAPHIEHATTANPSAARFHGFAEGVWRPEDLVALPDSDWIVVSAMGSVGERGALFAVRADARAPAREIPWLPEAEAGRVSRMAFDPHGIDVRRTGADRFELLVVDHGGGEAIDRLAISMTEEGPVIVAGERIVQPRHTSGNAVAHLPNGGIVMSSMFDPQDDATLRKFADGVATGRVWRWSKDDGWRPIGPSLSGANGVAASRDGEQLLVSEWAARRVWRLRLDGSVIASVDVDVCSPMRSPLAGSDASRSCLATPSA
jgi:hypothetical protein